MTMTVDEIQGMEYWLDGERDADAAWVGAAAQVGNLEPLRIGHYASTHDKPPASFQGEMDNIAIYERVLSPDEIKRLAKR